MYPAWCLLFQSLGKGLIFTVLGGRKREGGGGEGGLTNENFDTSLLSRENTLSNGAILWPSVGIAPMPPAPMWWSILTESVRKHTEFLLLY